MQQRDFTSASFYQFLGEKKLMATRCIKCQALYLPPRPLCIKCGSEEMAWAEMSGKGALAAFTVIAVAPTFMIKEGHGRDNPYCTGVVELAEGPKISARILGLDVDRPHDIKIGTPLTVSFVDCVKDNEDGTYLAFSA